MSASSSSAPLVFGLVVLDLQKRQLTRKGRARPLRATSFDVLAYLASNGGRTISNGELAEAVWPGRSVSAETLSQCLAEVRQALRTDASVIRTIAGEGYRFEAEVRRADPGTDPFGEFVEDPDTPVKHVTATAPLPAPPKARAMWWLAAAAVAVAGGVWLASTRSLPPAEARRSGPDADAVVAPQVTLNTQVVQLMVTGNDAAAKQTPVELRRARAAYEQAVKTDPRYAPAYGALANTLAALAALAVDQPKELLPVADAYARRAIELDPNHPLGWSALAQAHVQWTRNWVGAEAGFRRALALDANTPSAAANLALLLAALNRPSEALEQSRKALQLDVESPALQASTGIAHVADWPRRGSAAVLRRRPQAPARVPDRSHLAIIHAGAAWPPRRSPGVCAARPHRDGERTGVGRGIRPCQGRPARAGASGAARRCRLTPSGTTCRPPSSRSFTLRWAIRTRRWHGSNEESRSAAAAWTCWAWTRRSMRCGGCRGSGP